jgi:hypothetical protein
MEDSRGSVGKGRHKETVRDKELLASARAGVRRSGRTQLVKWLTGNRLTQREAIKAKCYDCNGMGEQDTCDIEGCPLRPYSPYKASQEVEQGNNKED